MRAPAVAGAFYPFAPAALEKQVAEFFRRVPANLKKGEARAIVSPHAGYIYSGQAAAYSFSAATNLRKENVTAILLCPSHTGLGLPVALSQEDWSTPLGKVENDLALGKLIKQHSKFLAFDEAAHSQEHSLEVQLPFLQVLNPKAKIVPICLMAQGPPRDAAVIADLAQAMQKAKAATTEREIIVIASSDFTHYESAESARQKDMQALALIEKLAWEDFIKLVFQRNLSICGFLPIAVALAYSRLLGAKRADTLYYTNSGETSGDFGQVVAYTSVAVFK